MVFMHMFNSVMRCIPNYTMVYKLTRVYTNDT